MAKFGYSSKNEFIIGAKNSMSAVDRICIFTSASFFPKNLEFSISSENACSGAKIKNRVM
jgi:hypothetical protein